MSDTSEKTGTLRTAQEKIDAIDAAEVREALDDLVALVEARLPERFYPSERFWRKVMTALLARMAGTVRTIAAEVNTTREADVHILVRSLYEHMVMFAWLAIDPERHVDRWRADSRRERLKIHNDSLYAFGEGILSDEEVATIKADASVDLPPVTDLAKQADEYWVPRVKALHPGDPDRRHHMLSLRGLYIGIYRVASRSSHPSLDGMVFSTNLDSRRRLVVDLPVSDNLTFSALAVPLFAIALVISHQVLGWPDADEALKINEAFPDPA